MLGISQNRVVVSVRGAMLHSIRRLLSNVGAGVASMDSSGLAGTLIAGTRSSLGVHSRLREPRNNVGMERIL